MSQSGDNLNPDPNESDRDPFIDALLDEKVGGISPPDLSSQILARLDNNEKSQQKTLVSTRRTSHARQYKSVRSKGWTSRLITASTLAAMVGVCALVVWKILPSGDPVASVPKPTAEVEPNQLSDRPIDEHESLDSFHNQDNAEVVDQSAPPNHNIADADTTPSTSDTLAPGETKPAAPEFFAETKYDRASSASTSDEVVTFIQSEFRRIWDKNGITPARQASEDSWLVRVFDRTIGRAPTTEETDAHNRSRSETKRADIVAALTTSEEYKAEFDEHWTQTWSLQFGKTASSKTIAEAVRSNAPYNQMLRQIVDEPQADFASICQNVLGTRMDCANCHSEIRPQSERQELLAEGFKNHREPFAMAISNSDEASETMVNNVWAHFLGAPLTPKYVASKSTSTPVLSPTLQRLTQEFIASDFDTKQLMTWIVLSEPFGLSDQITKTNEVDSAIAQQPLFARHYSNGRFADSIAQSLNKFASAEINLIGKNAKPVETVASLETSFKNNNAIDGDKVDWTDIAFMNTDPDRANILQEHGPYLRALADTKLRSREKVEHVFLSAIGRMPTSSEREPAIKILRSQKSNAILGLRDVWWAISKGR